MITDTMIADIGAMNLKDVLVTYVPGMTFSQDHNEVNVAMRGVYASSQQKILILVDGHVLNSRSYSAADPDFSIGLDKIKRIEVVRGPASSLYGNGALAAVVNIFTKSAADVDEGMVSAGAGNFGQLKTSALYGARTQNGGDILAWGSVYKSDGQVVAIPAAQDYSRNPADSHAILDGFNGPVSHDVGLRVKTPRFTMFAAHRFGKYTEPFSAGGPTGESYNASDYQDGDGIGPGYGMGSVNLDIAHEGVVAKGATLLVRGYFDKTDHIAHLITDPSQRAHSVAAWAEWTTGVSAQIGRSYGNHGRQGRWLAGAQADFSRVYDSTVWAGTGGSWATVGPSGSLLVLGDEKIYSGFFEIAHPLSERWLVNGGLRDDIKIRRDGPSLNNGSPRVALTYLPNERSAITLSYSGSFVDAPYFYRYNTLVSYRGGRDLQPEHLKSLQLTPTTKVSSNVTARTNVFVNRLDDLIWRNKNAGPTEPIYQNAGYLENWGVEQEITYAKTAFDITGNLTYQRAIAARNYDVTDSRVHNVPNWTANAIVNVNPPSAALKDVRFNVTLRYVGAELSPVDLIVGSRTFSDPALTTKAVVLVNSGARIRRLWSTRCFLDGRVYNLFDTRYEQGGSVSHPYPQAGRSATVTAGYTF